MTKKQFAVIATAIKTAYPASKVMESDQEMEFWYKLLEDLDSKVVENAVMEYMCIKKFPPSIAEIRELCVERMARRIPSADDAWGLVQKAISRYGYYNPEEAFATMDDITLAVVKNFGWSRICKSENSTADRANFRMAYEEKAKELKERRQLPEFIVQRRLELQEKYIQAIEQKPVPKLETAAPREPASIVSPDEEQQTQREKMIEDLRRRMLSGEEKSSKDSSG